MEEYPYDENGMDAASSSMMVGIDNDHETPPIIYCEDPTYTRVLTEEGRAKVRQWKFGLERRLGLYNARLRPHPAFKNVPGYSAAMYHECDDSCFAPIVRQVDPYAWMTSKRPSKKQQKRTVVTSLDMLDAMANEEEEEEEDTKQRESSNTSTSTNDTFVEAIDRNMGLFGCPMSAQVHVCPPTPGERRMHCHVTMQDELGNTCCRYSSWLITMAEGEHNPYTDDNVSLSPALEKEDKISRDMKAVSGEGAATLHDVQRDELDVMREKNERQEVSNMNKNLANKAARRQAPQLPPPALSLASLMANANNNPYVPNTTVVQQHQHHVVPSLEAPIATASPMKRRLSISSMPTTATTPVLSEAEKNSQLVKRRKTHVILDHDLAVPRDTFTKIKKTVIELLTDAEANRRFNSQAPTLNILDDAKYIDLCCRRAATIYALIKEEGEHDKERAVLHQQQQQYQQLPLTGAHALRTRRQGACVSVNVIDVTVSALYMYARGMTIQGGTNLIMADERLSKLLPPPKVLCWYGIDHAVRREMLKSGAAKMVKGIQKYTEQTPREAMHKIQQAIQAAFDSTGRGPQLLRQILNIQDVVIHHKHQQQQLPASSSTASSASRTSFVPDDILDDTTNGENA
jgi:hypothetical protein